MKILGEICAEMEVKNIRKHGESRTRLANIVLKVKVLEDDAKKKFGAAFHRIAFGGLVERKDGLVEWPCECISKPTLVVEPHEVEMFGFKSRPSIEIPKITPVEGEKAVIAELALGMNCEESDKAMIGTIAVNAGETIRANFTASQLDLPLTGPEVRKQYGKFGKPVARLV